MEKSSFSNHKRVLAVKTILEREKMYQKDIAELIDREPQNFSRDIVNESISDKTCRKIHEKLPQYRLEWLMGYDDYPTNEEFIRHLSNEVSSENYLMFNAIRSLATLNGYDVEIKEKSDIANNIRKTLSTGKGKIGDSFKEYMVFKRSGKKEFSLSLEDANHFGNYINDIFLSHIKWNIKK